MAFGHASRTTLNLGLWPRFANNPQPWPLATLREQPSTLAFGHASRTTLNLGLWPRFANNPQLTLLRTPRANNLWPLATLREQQ
ncbi:hypothetical protein [Moorena producens]|uniref:hypothetical protein n=1 Tax=Moorena producens TaxID=1155739 RepID=UPI0011EA6066|nr:hypothetical protein [Moorena producens]